MIGRKYGSRKFFIATGLVGFLAILSTYYLGIFPIVTLRQSEILCPSPISIGEEVNPFGLGDSENGEQTLYYIQDLDDKDGFFSVRYTSDNELIKKIRPLLNCEYTGGDVATTQSRIILVIDGTITMRLEASIVLDEAKPGLQVRSLGWLEFKKPQELKAELDNLSPYLLPWLHI
ncbi:MAG: hypothetical protein HWD92_11720 [Flavobacteriia bacterium]|nr:hypothetical protein [Flavobacteriia bacterium]